MTQAQADQARKLFLYDGQTYVSIADMVRCSFDDVQRYLEGDVSVVEAEPVHTVPDDTDKPPTTGGPRRQRTRTKKPARPAGRASTPSRAVPPLSAPYRRAGLVRAAGDVFDTLLDEMIEEQKTRTKVAW